MIINFNLCLIESNKNFFQLPDFRIRYKNSCIELNYNNMIFFLKKLLLTNNNYISKYKKIYFHFKSMSRR